MHNIARSSLGTHGYKCLVLYLLSKLDAATLQQQQRGALPGQL